MTFRILPDTPDKENPYILTRSIVEPDDGRNKRCNLERYFTKEELKKANAQRRKGSGKTWNLRSKRNQEENVYYSQKS